MDKLIAALKTIRSLFTAVAETGLALVGIVLVVYLLLGGDSGDYVLSVVANVSLLVDAISPQTLVAIVLGVVALALFYKRP